jgi:hypothetical protein
MWNVFDATFIVICLSYIGLRIRGLASGDRKQQSGLFHLLFKIYYLQPERRNWLSIYWPVVLVYYFRGNVFFFVHSSRRLIFYRLAFFAVSHNMVVL